MLKLEIRKVGKRFGRRVLFRQLTFEAVPDQTVAITGSNGSGKSTLVQILAGVMKPTRGQVLLTDAGNLIPEEKRPMRIGLVAPYLNLYDAFSPRENLQFVGKARGFDGYEERINLILRQVDLDARADDAVGTFSSGMKQRMRFAFALFSDPAVLLLDEPTANLDEKGIDLVHRLIQQSSTDGKIVIIATNDASEAASCDVRVDVEDYR